MKYAIYDKDADGYLTKMEFEVGYSENTQFECGYNEYITEAQLLDTPKEAADAIVRIESFKFMEKGRFVTHSFDDTLNDQYIISEAGNPTKVVDSITVDLDGSINVKYGTMLTHWSTKFLEYAINRMNALQKAKSPKYTAWCNTFDIYKVITVTDERSCTHYQFINVTTKGLTEYAKNEVDPLNKRIEELEKANYDLGEQVTARGIIANRLQEENDKLKTKVESIKKEVRDWKKLYENVDADREEFKNVIDIIYDDLKSETICDDLKDTLNALEHNSGLEHICMPTKVSYILDNGTYLTAKDEIYYIINQIITILESRELNQSVAFSSAEEVDRAKKLANDIIDICEATTDTFEVTLKKFSQLYEAVNDPGDDDDTIMYAFKGVLEIFSSLEDHVKSIIDESITWKHKTQKAEKELEDQKKLNEANNVTIVRYRNERRDMDKENHELRTARDCSAEIIYAIRNAIANSDTNTVDCIESRMRHDPDFNSDPFMAGVRENIEDICIAIKRNIANHELKNSEISKLAKEITDWKRRAEEAIRDYTKCNEALGEWKRKCKAKDKDYETLKNKLEACEVVLDSTHDLLTKTTEKRDKALERAEFYKRQANSVYGMSIPSRCNGKQMFCDIATGKKLLIDKKKYDELIEWIDAINTTYDTMFFMDKPAYLPLMIEHLNDLTK